MHQIFPVCIFDGFFFKKKYDRPSEDKKHEKFYFRWGRQMFSSKVALDKTFMGARDKAFVSQIRQCFFAG